MYLRKGIGSGCIIVDGGNFDWSPWPERQPLLNTRDCQIFCARSRFRHQITNLSPKITANWVFASNHSRGGRFHSSAA